MLFCENACKSITFQKNTQQIIFITSQSKSVTGFASVNAFSLRSHMSNLKKLKLWKHQQYYLEFLPLCAPSLFHVQRMMTSCSCPRHPLHLFRRALLMPLSQSKIPAFCPTALSLRPSRKIHCSYLHLRNEPNALVQLSSKLRFTHDKRSYGLLVLFWASVIIIFFEYILSVAVKWKLFQLDGHSFLHSDIFAYFCMSEHHP